MRQFEPHAVTRGPKHHWFGYYDKSPWDGTGRWLLATQAAFADRPPKENDVAILGAIDLASDCRFEPFAETTAWCWQTGCMLQWLPGAGGRTVIYNVREKDRFASVAHDLDTGRKRTLPLPVFCLTPDGRTALSLNFARLAKYRPGYGYEGVPDPFTDNLAPEQDGVRRMDVCSGRHKLVLSLAQLAEIGPTSDMAGAPHRVNHVQINTDGSRFAVLHRYVPIGAKGHHTRLFTAGLDGSNVCLLNPNRKNSHYDWRDPDRLLIWARVPGTSAETAEHHYLLFTDRTAGFEIVGRGVLTSDGHCSYSPDRRRILTDTYPDPVESRQSLLLYDPAENRLVEMGRFHAHPAFGGDIRCDLHPRWRRDGRAVCFDSTMDGTRQIYVIEVEPV